MLERPTSEIAAKEEFIILMSPKNDYAAQQLREVIEAFGHDPSMISVHDLQDMANRLSKIVKHEPAWGWRYLRNVLNRKIGASRKLVDAMLRLGAMLDSTPMELATSERVSIQAAGHVRPGALVLADSRPCANPGCRIEFVPRTPNQQYHSTTCRMKHRRGGK